jgi:hypothetical protein
MIQKRIKELGLDTSHFLGSAILKGTTHDYNTRPLEQILVHRKVENTWRLKKRLLQEGIKKQCCELCGATEWQGQPIPLELHHLDGDRTNNTLANIRSVS